jgi:hypothetical protein
MRRQLQSFAPELAPVPRLQRLDQFQQPLSICVPCPVCRPLQNPFHFLVPGGLRVPESQHLRHRLRDPGAKVPLPGLK